MKKRFRKEELNKIAKSLILKIIKNNNNNAVVVALYGELGSGKTNLTKEIALQFGIKEKIVSPTFVIMKNYKMNNNKFKNLVHMDAYRIEKSSELINLKFEEILLNPENLVFIEWPEKVQGIIPAHAIKVFISHVDEDIREIEF